MLFAESHNGACADPVAGAIRLRESVSSKGDPSTVGVFNLKHELRFMDTPDDDFPLVFRKLFTGVYGVFQGVGKADRKLGGIDG